MNEIASPRNTDYVRLYTCFYIPETITQRAGDDDVGQRCRRLCGTCQCLLVVSGQPSRIAEFLIISFTVKMPLRSVKILEASMNITTEHPCRSQMSGHNLRPLIISGLPMPAAVKQSTVEPVS